MIIMKKIQEITPLELEEIMDKDTNILIIDVREDEEVQLGMIEDALHISLQNIPNAVDKLQKSKHYVLVCKSGVRSYTAALFLKEKGFKVSNMVGGMLDWQGEIIA